MLNEGRKRKKEGALSCLGSGIEKKREEKGYMVIWLGKN